jgi:diamine N-acetyltransferase
MEIKAMDLSSVVIRTGQRDDAPLLADLGARTFAEAFSDDNTPDDMAAYLAHAFSHARLVEELSEDGSLFLIAEVEGEAVGYARLLGGSQETCITGQNPVELVRIYTRKAWNGKGIGSRLMQACLDTARGRGYDVIWLGVWQKNAHAISFYERWGFRIAGTHVFQLGSDPQTDWIMQKTLNE